MHRAGLTPQQTLGTEFGFLASPPPMRRVVARAHVLCALLLQATLATGPDPKRAQALSATVLEWLIVSGADLELDVAERALLSTAPSALSAADAECCGWLGEGAVVIAWAVRRASVPAPGVTADASRVAEELEFLADGGGTLYSRAQLRPRGALLQGLELIELAESRVGEALDARNTAADSPSLARFRSAEYSWPEAIVPFEFAGDDLALDGRALRDVSRGRLASAWRGLRERRRAARWLVGAAALYSAADGEADLSRSEIPGSASPSAPAPFQKG